MDELIDLAEFLKGSRKEFNLSRPTVIKELQSRGVISSLTTLERLENGKHRSINLVVALAKLYAEKANLKLSGSANVYSRNSRLKSYITNNLDSCSPQDLRKVANCIEEITGNSYQ